MISKLHYISQATDSGTHLNAIEEVLKAGGKWVQLRVKSQPEAMILELAIEANALCRSYGAKLIVNDYPLIALKAKADGVHLGLNDMPIPEARAIVGDQMIIGGTANTFEHIVQRIADGANYIGLGPYRFTSTKQNLSPIIGLQGYKEIIEQVHNAGITIPVIAIGGIELEDITSLTETGLYGVAVSGALTNHADLKLKLQEMKEKLQILNTLNH